LGDLSPPSNNGVSHDNHSPKRPQEGPHTEGIKRETPLETLKGGKYSPKRWKNWEKSELYRKKPKGKAILCEPPK